MLNLKINGKSLTAAEGQTILEVARNGGIDIPTFCESPLVEISGACGICVCEAEGNSRLLRSCATLAADGMVISTESKRVVRSRKAALELLMSDHTGDCQSPCTLACPARTDCQGYVGEIAKGNELAAYERLMEKLPLPASIGRVCPHPCEEACRRELVEEPASILGLKRYAADSVINSADITFSIAKPTGKSVAVIGGGPGGLTAAFFLRLAGMDVKIYEAMPEMGGMLRYGIPEYRLPKSILQREIDILESTGIVFNNNVKVGVDVTLDTLRKEHNAVIIAAGAWVSTPLGCQGENLIGVIGGIDFLREPLKTLSGQKVAIVGGGNTAMDACRTALRLDAEKVYNIYRRTRSEMPAEEIEITEAEEEGVIFKNLTNPSKMNGKDGAVSAVELQIMELGEPDSSGRRRPVPTDKTELLEIDKIIVAIGQKFNPSGFDGLKLTNWGTIAADEADFKTNLDGVFAIGDATNNGASIAIEAIGEARRAAEVITAILAGETPKSSERAEAHLAKTEKTARDFKDIEKVSRAQYKNRLPSERSKDFLEINQTYSKDEARKEAERCLDCGCADFSECKLVDLAAKYKIDPQKYEGRKNHHPENGEIPGIVQTPDKCILCGLCVRICEEDVGAGILGILGRGFEARVKPFSKDYKECKDCGKCAENCPTGALMLKQERLTHEI